MADVPAASEGLQAAQLATAVEQAAQSCPFWLLKDPKAQALQLKGATGLQEVQLGKS
jgi:hypothetical protein